MISDRTVQIRSSHDDIMNIDSYRYEGAPSITYKNIVGKAKKTQEEVMFIHSYEANQRKIYTNREKFDKIIENYLTRHPEYV